MPHYKYSTKIEENMAKAVSHSLPISTKAGREICRFIKGMPVAKAKETLVNVTKKTQAVPYTRYFQEQAHKKGMAVGRYPVKAATNILTVIESAEANAQFKGLNTADLVVHHAASQQGPAGGGGGRTAGSPKRTHIEIVLQEKKIVKKPKKVRKQPTAKPEVKKEEPKVAVEEPKVEEKPAEAPKAEETVEEVKEETAETPAEEVVEAETTEESQSTENTEEKTE
jgi:large subunit ribosomal protein L22